MQASGKLQHWNDERGFGFIAPAQGGAQIFVHISAFPRDGSRPVVGEQLWYDLGKGRDGKAQAVNVRRLAAQVRPRAPMAARRAEASGISFTGVFVIAVLLVIAVNWGYGHYQRWQKRQDLAAEIAPARPFRATATTAAPTGAGFRCDGRTMCSQMRSCEEATWFINNCPGTRMDGEGDGIPCERQLCGF